MSKVFVSIEAALRKAQQVAGTKDVRISGGANVIQQYLNAGLVEELDLQIAPMFLGKGMRLFDQIDKKKVKLEIVKGVHSPLITHLQYNILKV